MILDCRLAERSRIRGGEGGNAACIVGEFTTRDRLRTVQTGKRVTQMRERSASLNRCFAPLGDVARGSRVNVSPGLDGKRAPARPGSRLPRDSARTAPGASTAGPLTSRRGNGYFRTFWAPSGPGFIDWNRSLESGARYRAARLARHLAGSATAGIRANRGN